MSTSGLTGSDLVFNLSARAIGVTVLVLTGGIGFFLALQAVPTLQRYGWSFFIETQWQPEANVLGIGSVLVGTFSVALVALSVAFPLALLTALYICEYAPAKLQGTLTSLVSYNHSDTYVATVGLGLFVGERQVEGRRPLRRGGAP